MTTFRAPLLAINETFRSPFTTYVTELDNTYANLERELIARGLIFAASDGSVDMYGRECELHSVHEWGFILVEKTVATDPVYKFYDNSYSMICSFLDNDYNWRIMNSVLFGDNFEYDLMYGAPLYERDIVEILCSHDYENFIVVTKDKKYVISNGFNRSKRYSPLPKEYWDAYINTCNHCIVTNEAVVR